MPREKCGFLFHLQNKYSLADFGWAPGDHFLDVLSTQCNEIPEVYGRVENWIKRGFDLYVCLAGLSQSVDMTQVDVESFVGKIHPFASNQDMVS